MNYAVVLAGGKGRRFGCGKVLKQFVQLTGVPLEQGRKYADEQHNQ